MSEAEKGQRGGDQAEEAEVGFTETKSLSCNRSSSISAVCRTLFSKQVNQPGLFTGGFTVANKKNI